MRLFLLLFSLIPSLVVAQTAIDDLTPLAPGTTRGTVFMCAYTSDSIDSGEFGAIRCGSTRQLMIEVMQSVAVKTDRSAFTDGTTGMTPIGGIYNETFTSPTEDQTAAIRMTNYRGLHVNLRSSLGVQIYSDANTPAGGGGENALYTWNQANQQDDTAFTIGSDAVLGISAVATTDLVDSGDAGALAMTTARSLNVNLAQTAGTTTPTDTGDVATGVLRVREAGSPNITTGQVSCGSTSTSLVAARGGRIAVSVTNLGTTDVYIGASGVTTATGDLLLGVKGGSATYEVSGALYCIVGAGSQSVTYAEVY